MRKKIIKVLMTVFIISAILIPCFTDSNIVDAVTQANTLRELRKELSDYIAKREAAKKNQSLTQGQINSNKNSITSKQSEIELNKKKIEEASAQIVELDKEIEDTDQKIKDLLRSNAISNGDNAYLEYIFGAKSISDFIIRYSVGERVAKYNDELITSYEEKIKENEQLKIDLANREVELNNQIDSLEQAIDSLGDKLNTFVEEALEFDKEVKSTQELIDQYVKMGCKEDEPFTSCVKMMSDTGFLRPLNKGIRTSNFGYRTHPVTGVKNKFHSGVDIGGNPEGTPVYSAANGMVGKIINRASCGGNQVYVYHTINGVKYTTTYMHLLTIKVKVGDYVTNKTVVGTVGGGAGTRSYDSCSTGAHLHFSLAKGWYGSTYVSYSTWIANLVDPGLRKYANIPGYGVYFYSRNW